MKKTAGRVLKSNDVKLEGRFHLDMGQTTQGQTKRGNVASATPQVRIVESHSEFAIIEITCSCGTKTHLRCEYTGVESSDDQKPDQTK